MYKLYKKSEISQARTGILKTKHGRIKTPFFMPIATKASVKSLTVKEVNILGAQILLSNTYHLYLRPGIKVMKKIGGLHKFMDYQGPILTDSGGYQVFSLAGTKNRKGNLVKIKSGGVEFHSHLDGSKHYFTPKKVLDIQKVLGSDIAMVLDVCSSYPVTKKKAAKDLELTLKWARQSKLYMEKMKIRPLVFAIVQGSTYKDLRLQSAHELVNLNFDGYAIGGLAVGEANSDMYKVLNYTLPALPIEKPRYLMGVGRPENIIKAVKLGIDMFDCVIPTREARHGRLFIRTKKELKGKIYKTINITNSKFKSNTESINMTSLKNYSLSYLHHLFRSQEPLALRMATINNLEFYLTIMEDIRKEINQGRL